MAVYGYIRVSTSRQDGENQKYAILEYTNRQKLGNVDFVEETVSGTVSWQKRELASLIDRLKKGDILIVAELSRLGRSMLEVMEILSILTRKGVTTFSIKGDYKLDGSMTSRVLAFAFSLAAEVERELISSRTKEALGRRRAEGKPLGRPRGSTSKSKLDGREEQIRELLRHRVAKAAIARILNVSRPALLDFIKSRKLM
ncbi:recombinase family protein [Geobacter sp. AOG1]|uniref:recombinase family protein n=1 Tax=Geobacter sp. AOG1 TaxID=1566346 RepID=UPI001CC35779|nr:recombinase family protein [Geobacter sp. AOG1]GFE56727.1 invertase [Geobacter sp. AOG1]